MEQGSKITLTALILFVFAIPAFSGELHSQSGNFQNKTIVPFQHRFIHSFNSNDSIQKHRLEIDKHRKHKAGKSKFKKHPHRFLYDPRIFYFGGTQSDRIEKTEIKIIVIDNEKDESFEPVEKEDKPIIEPKIVNLNDSDHNDSGNSIKSTGKMQTVTVIKGGRISEIQIPTD